MSTDNWIPEHLDMEKPSAARIYDYLLGGHHNFQVDREAAHQLLEIYPGARLSIQANRAFLRRAVRFFLEQGIDQLIDIGSGIPTAGHAHEVAREIRSDARIVYVDIDPVAVAHSKAILRDEPNATVIQADARQPADIFTHPDVLPLIDFDRPVALFLMTLVHFVPDEEQAHRMLREMVNYVVSESYLAVTHSTKDEVPTDSLERMEKLYARSTTPFRYRTYDEIMALFSDLDLELIEPGLVLVPLWRPDSPDDVLLGTPGATAGYAGVWHKV